MINERDDEDSESDDELDGHMDSEDDDDGTNEHGIFVAGLHYSPVLANTTEFGPTKIIMDPKARWYKTIG